MQSIVDEKYRPTPPEMGPPLPRFLNFFWPWYKTHYTCPYCHEVFPTYEYIVSHVAEDHPGAAAPGCVSLLSMTPDEGKLIDLSGNKTHGTIINAIESEGYIGTCLSFDGTGYVSLPLTNTLAFPRGKPWSWELRILLLESQLRWQPLWSRANYVPPAFFYQSGRLFFYPERYEGRIGYVDYSFGSGEWSHVGVTCDGGATLKTFMKGMYFRDIDIPDGMTSMSFTNLARLYDRYFIGKIDEARIYNRALTGEEMQARASWMP